MRHLVVSAVALAATTLTGCLDQEEPSPNVTMTISLSNEGALDNQHLTAEGEIWTSGTIYLLGREDADGAAKEYIPAEELEGATACVTVYRWFEVTACAGCGSSREYDVVVPQSCQPVVLTPGGSFELTAEDLAAKISATFAIRALP